MMTACEGARRGEPGLKGGQEGANPRRDEFRKKGPESRKIKQGEKKGQNEKRKFSSGALQTPSCLLAFC